MSFTVGLDFGTHQTKICIENATNPAQKLYEFVEFINAEGDKTVLFPSIVQINDDETVSYGFVDSGKCKTDINETLVKPKLELLPELVQELPQKPLKPKNTPSPNIEKNRKNLTWKEQLLQLNDFGNQDKKSLLQEWKNDCIRIDQQYEEAIKLWEVEVNTTINNHNREKELWEGENHNIKKEYEGKIKDWEINRKEKLNYRYFKLASFSDSVKWDHNINPDIISVWFIAYNIFILQEKLGENFSLQMGIPSGINKVVLKNQEKKAYAILIAAYKLVDLYKTKDSFLAEKHTNLLEITKFDNDYSDNDINFYGLIVMPEAYAGLSSITQQRRIETGLCLLVDIGGGTTDIAFFSVKNTQPDIHAVISFHKGLNYIFEQYLLQNNTLSVSDVQSMFFELQGRESEFSFSINKYKEGLREEIKEMLIKIDESFKLSKSFHDISSKNKELWKALEKRPAVYCGGGAIYASMRTEGLYFTDIKILNKDLLNMPNLLNQHIDDKLYTILATSYGLSIPKENEIILTPIEEVFDHIEPAETNEIILTPIEEVFDHIEPAETNEKDNSNARVKHKKHKKTNQKTNQKSNSIYGDSQHIGKACTCNGYNENCSFCEGTGRILRHSISINYNISSTTKNKNDKTQHIVSPQITNPVKKENFHESSHSSDSDDKRRKDDRMTNYFIDIEKISKIHKSLKQDRCIFCNEKFKESVKEHFNICYFTSFLSPECIHEVLQKFELKNFPKFYNERYTRTGIIEIIQRNIKSKYKLVQCPFCNFKVFLLAEHFQSCRVLNNSQLKYLSYFLENVGISGIHSNYSQYFNNNNKKEKRAFQAIELRKNNTK